MASVATKSMTAEEFFAWRHLRENRFRYRGLELVKGEIVEVPFQGELHEVICANAAALLLPYTQQLGIGHVNCRHHPGLIVRRDPDIVREPHVALYLEGDPFKGITCDYSEHLPALVVEVLSQAAHWLRTLRRITEFQAIGVPLVWLVDPEDRSVTVFRKNTPYISFEKTDTLTGMDVLPGFHSIVSSFFHQPGFPRSYP